MNHFMGRLNLSQKARDTTGREHFIDSVMTILEFAVYAVMVGVAIYLISGRANSQTFDNGKLIWDNDTNIQLYVVLESPNLALPRQLWNVAGCVTNVPPSTNTQLSFSLCMTNRYPDAPWINWDYFMLLEWPTIPDQTPSTNWYALQLVITPHSDAGGRTLSIQEQGQWFCLTNNDLAGLLPIAPMPGVTNNNLNFNIGHF